MRAGIQSAALLAVAWAAVGCGEAPPERAAETISPAFAASAAANQVVLRVPQMT